MIETEKEFWNQYYKIKKDWSVGEYKQYFNILFIVSLVKNY